MKLLFDQNLSYKLVPRFEGSFPGSKHVKDFGLTGNDDERIWEAAGNEGFIIVSKDSDFYYRSLLRGHPPKFIYVRAGNSSTELIATLFTAHLSQIENFASDPHESILIIG